MVFFASDGSCTRHAIAELSRASWCLAFFHHGDPVPQYCLQGVVDGWCPELVMGEKLASYCLTEPGAGSDAGSLRTSATLDGDAYVVNGSKVFISGAGETDVLVVMTRTADAGPKGVTALLIPADAEGIEYGKKEHKMGWNAQPTRMITFDNVRVPVSNPRCES